MSSVITTVSSDGSLTTHGPARKPSIFDKMFDNFRFGDKKHEQDENRPTSKQSSEHTLDAKSKTQVHVQETALTPFSINETQPVHEQKRSLSVAIQDVFRRGSEVSSKSRNSSPTRKHSTSSGRKHSFFQSHNPDIDSDVARNASVQSHVSSGGDNSRKNSYVPRNATSSFLSSTTLKSTEEREKMKASISSASGTSAATRNASIALSETSEASAGTASTLTSGRRPSGMVPNNVASRYMRSVSLSDEEKADGAASANRRRPSGNSRSRQSSNGENASIKPVALAPEQYQQWQNSVSKSVLRNVPFNKPGETLERHRMQSLAGATLAETSEEAEDGGMPARSHSAVAGMGNKTPPQPEFRVTPASPIRESGRSKKENFSVDTRKANGPDADRGRMDSGREDLVSPKSMTFGAVITGVEKNGQNGAADPELESLGFTGAVRV